MEDHLYSTLPERHIRLLTLSHLQDPPSGTLNVVSLDDDQLKFNALSYAWGNPGHKLDFDCSGKTLSVYENLGDFLRLASERYHQSPIWIDAICINQEDDAEKNHQIPLMAEIYNKATRVLAWLGSNSIQGDKAFAFIPVIAQALKDNPRDSERKTTVPDHSSMGIPPRHSLLWQDIGEIFGRAWFTRLWVMQEMYSSKDISVLCGREVVRWESVTSFVRGFDKHMTTPTFMTRRNRGLLVSESFRSTSSLSALKASVQFTQVDKSESARMSHLLRSMRLRTATRAVDKVYGALGMMPLDIQRGITVDVSMAEAEVYMSFTKCLFERGDASLVLCQTPYSPRSKGLPSWCPDFAEREVARPMGLNKDAEFSAGYEHTPSGKARIKSLHDRDTIEITGFEISRIADVVKLEYVRPSEFGAVATNLKWDDACLDMAKHFFDLPHRDMVLGCLCTSRGAGGRLMRKNYPWQPASEWVHDYKEWRCEIEKCATGAPAVSSKRVRRFINMLNSASWGRRFFISTERSMGLGPRVAQAGDVICILYGRPTPFILRPDPHENTHQLIGEAYVNDLMDGEAFKLRDKYALKDQTFLIK